MSLNYWGWGGDGVVDESMWKYARFYARDSPFIFLLLQS